MFGVNYDDDYDVVSNHVVDHINYDSVSSGGGAGSVGDDNDNEKDNGGGDDGDDYSRTNDDDDNGNNKDENYSDDEVESFWQREFDHKKLLLCIADDSHMHYVSYVHKKSCMISYNT